MFDQNFDSGSLDVDNTSVNFADPSAPVVTLVPRRTWGNQYWWVSFKASGLAGLTPEFRITTSGVHIGYSNSQRWAYSATPDDINSWSFFDNGSISGGEFVSSNNSAFLDDELYIAYGLPYTVSRTANYTASLIGNPNVSATASGNASLVIGQTLGTAGGGYTDDLGRSIPSQDLYGYKITDPTSTGSKFKIVTTTGNHSGEMSGTWTHQGFIDFALSDDPAAVELRQLAEIYVYPQSDPEGRSMGYFRSTPQNPAANHNRQWNATSGFTELESITSAMVADTGGDVDFFLDFHSVATGLEYYLHENNALTNETIANLRALEPTVQRRGTSGSSWAAGFGSNTLNAEVSLTPETGYLGSQPLSRYLTYGENYARAILSTIKAQVPPQPRSESVFLQKVATLDPRIHLRFGETGMAAGQQAVDSANNHHGTYFGSVTLGNEDPFDITNGKSAKFEGTSDSSPGEYVTVPDFDYTNTNNEFSVAFWFKTDELSGNAFQYMFSHGAAGEANSLAIYFLEDGANSGIIRTALVDNDDPTGFEAFDVSGVGDGEWHFYTLSVSADEGAKIYIDGFLRNSGSQGGDPLDPSGDIFIAGRSDLNTDRFYGVPGVNNGLLDELMIFDYMLDPYDIEQLYLSPVSLLAGDFDEDGDVDGNDFLAWQRGESPNALSSTDLDTWQVNYGNVSSAMTTASTTVPEPSSIVLLLMGVACSAAQRRRSIG